MRSLLVQSIEAYTELYTGRNVAKLPVLKVHLCLEEEQVQLIPSIPELEATAVFAIETICDALQRVPTVQVLQCYYHFIVMSV